MGFYYRKSIRLGPFRVNVSKSGVGYSVGGPGARTGVSSRGKRYTTFNLPGTGIGYRTSSGSSTGNGCLLIAIALLALASILTKAWL
jgi:hypothetical protein